MLDYDILCSVEVGNIYESITLYGSLGGFVVQKRNLLNLLAVRKPKDRGRETLSFSNSASRNRPPIVLLDKESSCARGGPFPGKVLQ